MCYIFVLYWEFHSYFNCFIKIYNPFIMKNLNKNEINISRFASKTMWTFVITTLISNVVNTMRFLNKLHQVRSQKWLENQIILSLLEQVNRIKHRANICQTGLKSFSRVSSNIVRIKAFLFFFKCIKIFTHLFLNGWFYNLPSIQFYGIINNLLFLRKYFVWRTDGDIRYHFQDTLMCHHQFVIQHIILA